MSRARVDVTEPGRYRRPLAAMSRFLDGLDAAHPPVPAGARVLAALGPKMLDLAAARARGAHPYLVTPQHTRLSREALGDGALVLPEQTVILCGGRDEARVDEHRAAGTDHVALQALAPGQGAFPRERWRRFTALL